MADRAALIARLEALTGPDREVDLILLNTFEPHETGLSYVWGLQAIEPGSRIVAGVDTSGLCADEAEFLLHHTNLSVRGVPAYTASLDAVIALVERELPGWCVINRPDPRAALASSKEGGSRCR